MTALTVPRIPMAAALAGVMIVSGCLGGSRAFLADQSVHITSPAPLAIVSQPFTVAWQAPRRPGGGYAVVVDLSPISPGASLRDLAPSTCRQVPSCQPSALYLAGVGVYVTASDEVTIPSLTSAVAAVRHQEHPTHVATVIGIDSRGRRAGSGAWQVEFRA